jgi:Peptidase family C25
MLIISMTKISLLLLLLIYQSASSSAVGKVLSTSSAREGKVSTTELNSDYSTPLDTNNIAYPLLKSSFVKNSVLASGQWIKTKTTHAGIHKITFAELKALGFQSPASVRFFGSPTPLNAQKNNSSSTDDLTPISSWQTADSQLNDCFMIFIPGTISWFFDSSTNLYTPQINHFAQGVSCIYLTEGTLSEIIGRTPSRSENPTQIVRDFDDFSVFKEDNHNLIQSGSHWFSTILTQNNPFEKSFKFQGHIPNEPFLISVAAASRSTLSSSLDILINNSISESIKFSPYSNFAEADYADLKEVKISETVNSDNLTFSLKYNGESSAKCWVDYVQVQTRRKLKIYDSQLQFCDSRSVKANTISQFQIENGSSRCRIWDVTSPYHPIEIESTPILNSRTFNVSTDTLRRFVAFDPYMNFPTLEKVELINNQNLHALLPPDMLIITAADFLPEAQRLATFHRQNDQLEVTVVKVSDIYTEFSGGIPDATAIRNFVQAIYQKCEPENPKLKYLLLFGKGTYDNLHPLSAQNPSFIPTWQSTNSINPVASYTSDDYFGLNNDGKMDIGIGRIPCASISQAKISVDKIVSYATNISMGEWKNRVCFVGDDEDNNIHVSDSEQLANFINEKYPEFITDKIYLDAYRKLTAPVMSYPDVNNAINERVKAGTLILNYVGHANRVEWAAEKVLTIADIDSWSNINKLAVVVAATCEFGRWDLADKESAGEHILFNQGGGGVALFAATRMVYSSSNFEMNKSFFNYVFTYDNSGNNLRLGDIIRLAKNSIGPTINSSKFGLIGDPATRINAPKYNVKTLEINNQSAEQITDTLKPLSVVNVWGEIQNSTGEKLSGYSGHLYPTVYDKPVEVSTLGNNGQTPFRYKVQNSILFKGNITVRNGEFSYAFEVPREMNYRIGNGLIRNYSNSNQSDASGSVVSLKFGGSPNSILSDLTGPKIKLLLDNDNFKGGDKVSKAPLLMANLEDVSGINTTGSAIGHDITLIIDNQPDNMKILNDYFQSGIDSYKNGKVLFQLPVLTSGEHTLTFKAWDLANNSSEIEIRFLVSSDLVIKKVIAFPNPFQNYIDFIAEYNRYSEKTSVEVEIFNQQGIRVDYMKSDSGSEGFSTQPLRWNPTINSDKLASGIYQYRFKLKTMDGFSAVKTGQLIYTH